MNRVKCLMAALLSLALLFTAGCDSQKETPEPETDPSPDVTEQTETGDELMTQAQFAEDWLVRLSAELDGWEVTAGEEEYSIDISSSDGEGLVLYTDNAYAQYLRSPEDGEDLFAWYLEALTENLNAFDEDTELDEASILPVFKPSTYPEDVGEYGELLVYEPYLDGMLLLYVQDTAYAVRMLLQGDLEEAELTQDSLLPLAVENLKRVAADLKIDEDDGFYFPVLEEAVYVSSLLLLDIWDSEHFPVSGDIIVAVPERDQMIVVGSDDQEAVDILTGYAQSIFAETGYPVYPGLLRWTGEGFVPFA